MRPEQNTNEHELSEVRISSSPGYVTPQFAAKFLQLRGGIDDATLTSIESGYVVSANTTREELKKRLSGMNFAVVE